MPRNKQQDPRRTQFTRQVDGNTRSPSNQRGATTSRPRSPARMLITPNSPHDRNPSTSNQASDRRQKQIVKARRKLRQKPGILALAEIRKFQSEVQLLVPKMPFHRLVREISQMIATERSRESGSPSTGGTDYKFQAGALEALQEASEHFMISMFEDANLCAIHGRRVTLMPKDLSLVFKLRDEQDYKRFTGYQQQPRRR